jgi:hypothetical protein
MKKTNKKLEKFGNGVLDRINKIKRFFASIGKFSIVLALFLIAAIVISGAGIVIEDGGFSISKNLMVASDTLFVDSVNSRIGIGTTSPSHPLNVDGAVSIIGQNVAHDTSAMILSQESSSKSQIRLYGADGATEGTLEFVTTASDASPSTIAMTIATGGKIGIGTTTPTEKLTVIGDINASGQLNLGANSASTGKLNFPRDTGLMYSRNTANNADIRILGVDSSDNIEIAIDGALVEFGGEIKVTDTNTGGNAGTDACIDVNGRLCACGTCA